MNIREMREEDFTTIIEIAKQLRITDGKTGWFNEDSIKNLIPIDINLQKGFIAEEDGKTIGFVTFTSCNGKPRIGWIGVDPSYHRKGIGKKLIEQVCNVLQKIGARELYVETPSKEEGMGNSYEGTYLFYEAVGFKLVKVVPKNERKEGCDMAILRKVIQ